MIYTEEGCRRK